MANLAEDKNKLVLYFGIEIQLLSACTAILHVSTALFYLSGWEAEISSFLSCYSPIPDGAISPIPC